MQLGGNMDKKIGLHRWIRWLLSVILVVVGLSVTWAWGQVARLAEPLPTEPEPQPYVSYAAWQPAGGDHAILYRSTDDGATWQPLALPEGATPLAWAGDGGDGVAVAMDDGTLLRSNDQGSRWAVVAEGLPALSLAWGDKGDLYLGTDSQGIYRLTADGTLAAIPTIAQELLSSPVRHLAVVGGRLFAATPSTLYYTDEADQAPGGVNWTSSQPVPEGISALAVLDRETVYLGTQTSGVYRSTDAGQTWQPANGGLGLAAGQMVKVTALRNDPEESNLLYAAVDYVVGSTEVYASAAGVFVTLDNGASWQPLAGPTFPTARQASDLVIVPGKPLYAQAATDGGLQAYEPDMAAALAAMEGIDPQAQATAARMLGLARYQGAGDVLLAALDDPDPAVGMAAADALARLDDPDTASGLLVALEHPNEQVRLQAARALGRMRVEAAVEPLRTMLLNSEGAAAVVAADALGHIGSPAAIDTLLTALAAPDGTPRWHAALAALEAMGEPAVGPLTELLAGRDLYARRNAAEALGWIGLPSATAALAGILDDASPLVREQAAWALGEIGDPAARRALERVSTGDASAAVRAAADMALVRIGERPVVGVRWPAAWAPALYRLQAVRWLVLGLSLAGAAWLAVGQRRLSLRPAPQRHSRQ